MTKREAGLRFDIHEQLSLPEEVDTIERLDEIELTPRIEMIARGESTVLKGYLSLNGSYTGMRNEAQSMKFQHQIPVDITIPTERIDMRNEIEVEIEQFDFDVVSKGRLQVSGVLLLRGLQSADTFPPSTAQRAPSESEEIIFVHEAGQHKEVLEKAKLTENTSQEADEKRSDHLEDENVGHLHPPEWSEGGWGPGPGPQSEAPPNPPNQFEDGQQDASMEENIDDDSDQSKDDDDYDWLDEELYRKRHESESESEPGAESEKQPEMKIAFIGKKTEDSDKLQAGELQNVLTSESNKSSNSKQEEATELEVEETGSNRREMGVEWKKLFLSKEEETPQFKKVRMCIVQKDETLHSIAERYDMNPREIILYNRMGEEQEIVAGQVLFIPQ